jgi:hypothetical protein
LIDPTKRNALRQTRPNNIHLTAARVAPGQPGTLGEQLALARGEEAPVPQPPRKSLRQVRAEVVLARLVERRQMYLPADYFTLRLKGLSKSQVDAAVEDLVSRGLATAEASRYSGILVRPDSEGGPGA